MVTSYGGAKFVEALRKEDHPKGSINMAYTHDGQWARGLWIAIEIEIQESKDKQRLRSVVLDCGWRRATDRGYLGTVGDVGQQESYCRGSGRKGKERGLAPEKVSDCAAIW